VRADLLRRLGRIEEARTAYDAALALDATSAERLWLTSRRDGMTEGAEGILATPGAASLPKTSQ